MEKKAKKRMSNKALRNVGKTYNPNGSIIGINTFAEVYKFLAFIKFIRKTGQCLSPYPFN